MSAAAASPCIFFARGQCRNGEACRFSHSAADGAAPTSPPKPCSFFAKGVCRDGENCRFSHAGFAQGFSQNSPTSYAPPTINPMGPIYSIDVECIATGRQHHDRAVAQISLVDGSCMPRLNIYVRPAVPVASYLTPLTGLTAELLDTHGVSIAEAGATLRAHLPTNAVLVGQNIAKDVEWLGLVEGRDFASMVDLAALLRVYNPQYGSYSYFSQDHYASAWLGIIRTESDTHDAVADAVISMRLFLAYYALQYDPLAIAAQGARVLSTPQKSSFAKLHPEWEGCCMGNRQSCKCGAPFFS
jgi:hypothetical protein